MTKVIKASIVSFRVYRFKDRTDDGILVEEHQFNMFSNGYEINSEIMNRADKIITKDYNETGRPKFLKFYSETGNNYFETYTTPRFVKQATGVMDSVDNNIQVYLVFYTIENVYEQRSFRICQK